MNFFYSLVFSNHTGYKIARHFLFWLLWICFFAFIESYRMYEMWHRDFFSCFPISVGSMLIQIPIDIAFCYSVIYFLLPHFFLKGKYAAFFIGWIALVFAAGTVQTIYFYSVVSAYRTWLGLSPLIQKSSVFLGALECVGSLNTEGGFAIAIKFGKMFAIKQKEAELLSSEKARLLETVEANAGDAIKPTFLFNALNRLYSLTQEKTIDTAESIKRINNLILYTSNDAKQNILPLQKEIDSLKEYIELEKISYDYAIRTNFTCSGSTINKQVTPYVLIPVAEYVMSSLGGRTVKDPWVNTEINIRNNEVQVKICSSKSAETSTLLGEKNNNLQLTEQRLKLLYPGGFTLKKQLETDRLEIELNINLSMRLGA